MRLLTYQMPDELVAIASAGEFDAFDLNAFFEAKGTGETAPFMHKSDVQKWLDIIRGSYAPKAVEYLKTGTRPPFPYSDVRLLRTDGSQRALIVTQEMTGARCQRLTDIPSSEPYRACADWFNTAEAVSAESNGTVSATNCSKPSAPK